MAILNPKILTVVCCICRLQGQGSYTTVPGPHVEQTRVILGEDTPGYSGHGEIVSTQTLSSKTRTVETITVSWSTNEK